MTTANKVDVAVFIDFENIYVSVREKFDATPNFESIMDRCEDYGRVVIARAYADWYRYPRITSALFANGIEPMYVPTYYYDKDVGRQGRPIKNSVDMHLCIDAMRTLYARTNIQRYVLVTGDRDFIPLVNSIRQEGKEVVIIGIGGAASSHLAQSADEFLFYEQIVDIRPMGQPSAERAERDRERAAERSERERGDRERLERADRERFERERGDRERERGDRQPEQRPERRERQPERQPERPVEKPVEKAPEPHDEMPGVYDTLVEAVHLARKRGYVCSLGSLKVLMKELLPNFKESRYRDSAGKPFVKFTDFVREAERLGRVQVFTSGTVNEVFLPGEDPYKLSQFVADLPSVEAEREIEAELNAEEAREPEVADGRSRRNGRDRRDRGRGRERLPELVAPDAELPDLAGEEGVPGAAVRAFTDRDWQLFRRAMGSFSEPTPFADIFNELRDLRNRDEISLTNQELKELLKQAINDGLLQRSNRGAKAHYRLVEDARPAESALPGEELMLPDLDDEPSPVGRHDQTMELSAPAWHGEELTPPTADLPNLESLGYAPAGGFSSPEAPDYVEPAGDLPSPHEPPAPLLIEQLEPAEPLPADAPQLRAPTSLAGTSEVGDMRPRRRRKKAEAEQQAEPAAETAAPAAEAEEAPKPRRRRKKAEAEQQAEPAAETAAPAAPAAEAEEAPKPRRRRRKAAEGQPESES